MGAQDVLQLSPFQSGESCLIAWPIIAPFCVGVRLRLDVKKGPSVSKQTDGGRNRENHNQAESPPSIAVVI